MGNSTLITDYVGAGTHAARPASPNISAGGSAMYYETDTGSVFLWSGSAWVISTFAPENGTWTPVDNSGASLAFTTTYAKFYRVGDLVTLMGFVTYPVTASAAGVNIKGLPYAAGPAYGVGSIFTNAGTAVTGVVVGSTSTMTVNNAGTGAAVPNSALSGANVLFTIPYSRT